jgi:predicted nucleic acid-binding protein
MDERRGRRYARRLGLPLTGTVGVLLLAKEDGLITAVAPLLQQLLDQGLYFSPELISQTLTLAQE